MSSPRYRDARIELPAAWRDSGLIDRETGILSGVWEQPRLAGYADLFQYGAVAANTSAFTDQDNFRFVGGASLDRLAAAAKAIGEGIERYCSAIYDINQFSLSRAAAAPGPSVDIDLLRYWTDERCAQPDFFYSSITDASQFRWVPARTLEGAHVYVPASLVYVPYYYDIEGGETPFSQPISTGLACHQSAEKAMLGGLMEVVERDAFTLTWQTRQALTPIQPESIEDDSREILRRIMLTGATVQIGFAPMDHGIPTCVVMQRLNSDHMPAVSVAAASAPSPAVAMRKALEELVHTFRWMSQLMTSYPPLDPGEKFANVTDQETHLRYWCPQERAQQAEFLFRGKEPVPLSSIPELTAAEAATQLSEAVARIRETGAEPLFVELTTPDVEDLGFRVYRALVPGYNPLFMGHVLSTNANLRLLAYAQARGLGERDLNHLPHPFP